MHIKLSQLFANIMDKITKNKLKELIKNIKEIDKMASYPDTHIVSIDKINNTNDTNNDIIASYNTYLFNSKDQLRGYTLINNVSLLAEEVFITSDGQVNYEHIEYVCKSNKNYNIYPLEQDRFGWLIGGIETEKGVISFG